jgi:hypothetical protein
MLWNPVGSGVILRVKAVRFSTSNTSDINLTHHNAVLIDDGTGSKRSGNRNISAGRAPKAELYWETNVGVLGTEVSKWSIVGANADPAELVEEDYYVPEGVGLVMSANATARTIHATFEWEEI